MVQHLISTWTLQKHFSTTCEAPSDRKGVTIKAGFSVGFEGSTAEMEAEKVMTVNL